MKFFFFIGLMLAAYAAAFLWRKKISQQHTEFKTKMDLAADEEQTRRLLQKHLEKK